MNPEPLLDSFVEPAMQPRSALLFDQLQALRYRQGKDLANDALPRRDAKWYDPRLTSPATLPSPLNDI